MCASAAPPVFVGGSGRSGTTVVARLISSHPSLEMIPVEARFHVDRDGLSDVLAGRTEVETFAEKFHDMWYFRFWRGGGRGLHWIATGDDYDRALKRFIRGMASDGARAGRRLLEDLFDPVAERSQAKSWVEMSPPNIERASVLHDLFPEAKFVHAVRDGRDVAASVSRLNWGPNDMESGIRWWTSRIRIAYRATQRIPQDRHFTLRLEDLVAAPETRRNLVEKLFCFLGLDLDVEVERFMSENVRTDRAHVGRWRDGTAAERQTQIDDLYQAALERLRDEGVTCLPSGD